jgi:hypothetical protein
VSAYPKSRITLRTLRVETEVTAEDEGDPRGFDISLDDEAIGLIIMSCLIHVDRNISFFVEQWPAIRSAVDQLAGCARTHDEVMGIAPKQEPVAWQGVHDKTDLYFQRPVQGDVRPLYAKEDESGLVMALSQASAMIDRMNRERSQIKHGLQGLVDYLGEAERNNSVAAPRAAAVTALRHAFNSAATILKAMCESECRMDPRK